MITYILALINRASRKTAGDLVGKSSIMSNNKLSINGKTFTGGNITVRDNKVYIDGVEIEHDPASNGGIVEVRVLEGSIQTLHSDCSVTAQDITGNATAGHNLNARNIRGNATSGHGMECENVGGSVKAGHSVNCGRVGGAVNAGHSVRRA